ncbi:hypothetical protein ABK040_010404 [Willaertia magna]
MSVLIETSLGEIVVDLWVEECPIACFNFLSLCQIKYYNNCKIFSIEKGAWFQTGDPTTNSGKGGNSIFHLIEEFKQQKKSTTIKEKIYFKDEINPLRKHNQQGLLCMANNNEKPNTNASQFYITTTNRHLDYLDGKHTIFGKVEEGLEVLQKINNVFTEKKGNIEVPIQIIRIRHTHILFNPFDEGEEQEQQTIDFGFDYLPYLQIVKKMIPEKSPEPILDDDEKEWKEILERNSANSTLSDNNKSLKNNSINNKEAFEKKKEREAKSKAIVLEMIGDLPDANVKPPENILFICRLNPITTSSSLQLIFSQFGKIKSCEVVKDKRTGKSKRFAFIEFEDEEACENAFLKMENVMIDDRRIHVDFSQSVARLWWENEQEKKKQLSSYNKDSREKDYSREDDNYREEEEDRHKRKKNETTTAEYSQKKYKR